MILGLGWQLVTVPPLSHPVSELLALIGPSVMAVPEVFGEAIGVFGWQDTLMPRPAYAVWRFALTALISPARRGRDRERRTLDGLVVACFGSIITVSALVALPTGFAVQGRHVLPALIALPLVSGEILYRNRDRIGFRSVASASNRGDLPFLAMRPGWWRRHAPAILFSAAVIALVISWLAVTPPGENPDEYDHYARAVSVGNGQWLGRPATSVRGLFVNPLEALSYLRTSRSVDLPARLATPDSWLCLRANHAASAACIERGGAPGAPVQSTTMGTRQPFAYILPGLAANVLGSNPSTALYAARIATAILSSALLLAAIWTVWDGRLTSLLGPALALSPAVLWIAASLNPSSPEIAAGVLMAAVVVRAGRPAAGLGTAWWASLIAGAVVLATARPLGVVWVAAYLLLLVAVLRPGRALALLRSQPRHVAVVTLLVAGAIGLGMSWQRGVPPAGVTPSLSALAQGLPHALLSIPESMGEEIGVFGLDDVLMPRWAYAAWGAALVVTIAIALLRGRKRDVRVLEVALVASFALRGLLDLFLETSTGSPVQGRSLLPMTVVVAFLAGETLHRNAGATRLAGRLVAIVGLATAVVQFAGWYSAARRFAVGQNGSWWLLQGTAWQPPGGWVAWLTVTVAACVLLAASLLPEGDPSPARD
ncbi:MAG: DUF2142 domain-containing protein [Candidatus Dormibacteria bacterium]